MAFLFTKGEGRKGNSPFYHSGKDTSRPDSLRFPINERWGDRFSWPRRNAFDMNPSSLRDSIIYDPATKQYYIIEKIGNTYYRKPTYLSFQDFLRIQGKKAEIEYFRKRANTVNLLNRKIVRPKLSVTNDLFNRIFGNGKVEIRPQGNVDVTLGYQGQKIQNPALPERAQRNGGFDFQMAANLNVDANIGDKLKLPIRYNTQANFDIDNQFKLDYVGRDDEMLKRFEAGNIAFQSKGLFIPSTQGLFGLKTSIQAGKLFLTGVLANQRTQRQSLGLQGGAASQPFVFRADEYEENRHFLLGGFFRNNFNKVMKQLPIVNSQIQIMRLEVWVTNRSGATVETRDVVGLMDLAEPSPYRQPPVINSLTNQPYPGNDANDLYRNIVNDPNMRNPALVTSRLLSLGLTPTQDFEKTFAKKLNPSQDYFFNPRVGFISLTQPLQPDEVLAVAYQYTYNGRVFQVGEFSQDVSPNTANNAVQKVLFLKLLKATSQRVQLPIWDLMMKNVYSVGFGTLQRDGFKMWVGYEEPGRGEKRYLPEGPKAGVPLMNLLNLDRLNNNNDPVYDPVTGDPIGDGVFDYIEDYTVISPQSRIIFPVLEPFGKDLEPSFNTQVLKDKYLYTEVYDSIKAIAQTFANKNRYVMRGTSKSSSSSEIYLGAFNIPPGSVTVTSGGQNLIENSDYSIDYNLGVVRILNQAIINSGVPVNVQYENNAGFGLQQRSFLGLRADYIAMNTAKKSLNFGATMVRLSERPFFTKMNYNEDPIRNTMFGIDFNYRSDFPQLTRWIDKLPIVSTKAPSTIAAFGEAAMLKPGHPPQIGRGAAGLSYLDDFEGTRNAVDLRFPLISWALASTPSKARDRFGSILFPESEFNDSLAYGFNRARLAWYNIEQVLQERRNANNPLGNNLAELSDPRVRPVFQQEIFPQRTPNLGEGQLVTFDMTFYPTDRGPYNFDTRVGSVAPTGKLLNPKRRWGGIMRALDQVDFETGNVEFVEMWIQDPFIKNPASTGGDMYLNLGNISEDVLKDGRRFFENGLNTPNLPTPVDNSSRWARTPANPLQVTQAFSNDPADRIFQDVGFDGLNDDDERLKFQRYTDSLRINFGANSPVYLQALADPASDNFRHYRDAAYDQSNAGILNRYKVINSPQGNSPVAPGGSNITTAYTLYPDQEELNRDNTLNELEEYFQYRLELRPNMTPGVTRYLTDKRVVNVKLADGTTRAESWFLFRIPINEYSDKIGNIPDFKSIRFIRLFLTNFDDSVTVRLGKLELVRNQWRRFNNKLDTTGQYSPVPNTSFTSFNVLAVNVEENDKRTPVPYVIPPGIDRVQQLSNNNVNILLNEQSLSLKVCQLADGDSRGVFKTIPYNLTQYGRLSMFVHAESVLSATDLEDNEMNAIIRIGSDFVNNYYEIKIPLKVTAWNTTDKNRIWPEANNLDLVLEDLIKLKMRRNKITSDYTRYYKETINGRIYSILGNPNLAEIRGVLLGVENPQDLDGGDVCAEVWFNELRLSELDEQSGWAATGRVDLTLADIGSATVSGTIKTIGFGTLEQRVNERQREDFRQFDVSATLELGRFLPKKAGISLPMYASFSRTTITPEFDPYDGDVKLKDKLKGIDKKTRDSILATAGDITTIKTINFTNVRKVNTSGKKAKIWSPENFDFSYSYTKTERNTPLIENDELTRHRGGIGYSFRPTPKAWEPFKKAIKSKSPWFALIKEFNLNPAPSLLSFRADIARQFGATRPRNVGGGPYKVPETYDKYFTFDRVYNLNWDLSRSLNIDFSATNNARIDEPYGRMDTPEKKDTIRRNFWKGGRNTIYDQRASATYSLPTKKFPLLDWTEANFTMRTTYKWLGASRLAINLGNILENSQTREANLDLNFSALYQKSRLLRAIEQDPIPGGNNNTGFNPAPQPDTAKGKKGKKVKVKRDKSQLPNVSGFGRFVGRMFTSLKQVRFTYNETFNTRLPGYMDSTEYIGNNWRSGYPGLDFVFGRQPDTNYINNFGKRGLLTRDSTFNALIQQNYEQRLTMTAQLQPIRDLTIDLNLSKTFTKNYSELYKDTSGVAGLRRLNPFAGGGFDISYIAFQTLFGKVKPNEISQTFQLFQEYRKILSERLGKLYPHYAALGVANPVDADGYYYGYGRYAQDVIVPAFVAAYTKKDPTTVALLKQSNSKINSNPFSGYIPRPNWRITYAGLTKIKGMDKIFTDFRINHGYTSNLSMNSFTSALLFQDQFGLGFPTFYDTVSRSFIPYFLVPNISLTENFSPLIDLDMQFTNQLTAKFEYKKGRTISLSLIDFQLSETRTTEFVIGMGWRKRGFPLPFKLPKFLNKNNGKKLENDLDFRLDFSIRDDITANSRLDQLTSLPTSGQKTITISPYISYVLNNRINVKLFFDQRRTKPYVFNSAPITTTSAGLQIRVSLAQ